MDRMHRMEGSSLCLRRQKSDEQLRPVS